MKTQLPPMSEAQAFVYSRANIKRAFPKFDDADIVGIYVDRNSLVITRVDGTEQTIPAEPVHHAFMDFTGRLPHHFEYMGANYTTPKYWKNNGRIVMKGHSYYMQGGNISPGAISQRHFLQQYSPNVNQQTLEAILNEHNIGYLVAPDGLDIEPDERTMHLMGEGPAPQKQCPEPYCSCGSFQRQLQIKQQLKEQFPFYQPTCKHLTWLRKLREYQVKRTALLGEQPTAFPQKCTAYYYQPPAFDETEGNLIILFTDQGKLAPIDQWQLYKPQKKAKLTQHDVWDVLDNMIKNGYVPFYYKTIDTVSRYFKQKTQSNSNEAHAPQA